MKSRRAIWASVAQDTATQCSVPTARDIETVTARVAVEGEAFFKVTLPRFAKDLEFSLEGHLIDPSSFAGFRRRLRPVRVGGMKTKKLHQGNPVFLGGLMAVLFDDTYEVEWDEYYQLEHASAQAGIPLHNFFPPMLRVPASEEEELRMANAIMAIRQLCLMFSKERELCSDEDNAAAIEGYKSTDEELMDPFWMDAWTT